MIVACGKIEQKEKENTNYIDIKLNINHQKYQLKIRENSTLLDVLREKLNLTGTKYGCGMGACGACKVLINGEAKNSCVILAKKMESKKIVTIEGLADNNKLHPVQEAFVESGAIQCGFCTPGMVITTVAFLNKNPSPTREEITDALEGNLCRCTGYIKIIDAVQIAAKKLRREKIEL